MGTESVDRGMDAYRRFLDGDEGGLTEIIEVYGDGLLRYINSYVKDEMTAEDLLSETFLKLIVHRPRLRGESLFKTYLYAVGRNEALRFLRRRKREAVLGDWIPDVHADDAYHTVLRREQQRTLLEALGTISPQYREVLYLVYGEDLSCREAAAVLHKSSKQVTNLLYRGKQALKTAMGGFEYENE